MSGKIEFLSLNFIYLLKQWIDYPECIILGPQEQIPTYDLVFGAFIRLMLHCKRKLSSRFSEHFFLFLLNKNEIKREENKTTFQFK
jgi:hypothetical protein